MNMNYYEILGIKENATKEEIKTAYKLQMKKWHPDINKSADAINMSTKINEAKEVLLDDQKRIDYDNYLKNKINEEYNKYTNKKQYQNANNKTSDTNKEKSVTKWQYLNDWLKYSKVSNIRKIFGVIGVILESFLCFIIKSLLIIVSFLFYILSDLIRMSFAYLLPIIGIILALFLLTCMTKGTADTLSLNNPIFKALLIIVLTFISSFILPLIGKILLSKKTFNILYNKIDINLFKICVGLK